MAHEADNTVEVLERLAEALELIALIQKEQHNAKNRSEKEKRSRAEIVADVHEMYAEVIEKMIEEKQNEYEFAYEFARTLRAFVGSARTRAEQLRKTVQ